MKKFNEFTEAYVGQAINSADKKTIKVTGPDGKPYFKQIPTKRNLTQEKNNLDEGHYHVSWGAGLSHTIMNAKSPSHAVVAAKAHLLKKIPKLADEKYSDTFNKKPSVTNITNEQTEYDEDTEMTRSELKIAINSAKEILDMMDDGVEIERWQVSEIVTASDSLSTVYQNLYADNMDMDDEEDDYEEDDE